MWLLIQIKDLPDLGQNEQQRILINDIRIEAEFEKESPPLKIIAHGTKVHPNTMDIDRITPHKMSTYLNNHGWTKQPYGREEVLKFTHPCNMKKIKDCVVHWKKEKYDVYIGRPSKWGNPFQIGRDGNREQVIEKYHQWILKNPDLLACLPELKGMVLGCWCKPLPCHGDVLIELANKSPADLTEPFELTALVPARTDLIDFREAVEFVLYIISQLEERSAYEIFVDISKQATTFKWNKTWEDGKDHSKEVGEEQYFLRVCHCGERRGLHTGKSRLGIDAKCPPSNTEEM